MSDITNISDHRNHITGQSLCLECDHQWIAVFEDGADPKKLECPSCSKQKSFTVLLCDHILEKYNCD